MVIFGLDGKDKLVLGGLSLLEWHGLCSHDDQGLKSQEGGKGEKDLASSGKLMEHGWSRKGGDGDF